MAKRFLAVLLAVALFSVSVFALEYPAAEDYTEEYAYAYETEDYYPEDSNLVRSSMMASGFARFDGWEEREFDDVIDQIFFSQFREGYALMRRNSVEVNRTITSGSFSMEVLNTIAVANGIPFTTRVPVEGVELEIDEFGWPVYDPDKFVDVMLQNVTVFTFVSLQDTTGAANFEPWWGTSLRLVEEAFDASNMWARTWWNHANVVHLCEDTGILYFVVHSSGTVDPGTAEVSIDFVVDRIFGDMQHIDAVVEVDFAGLLASHEATFTTIAFEEDGSMLRRGMGISHSWDMTEIMGADFDPFAEGQPIMTIGELNVRISDDIALTNIAQRGNLLLLQVSNTEEPFSGWPTERQTWFSLINNAVDIDDIRAMFDAIDHDAIDWDNIDWDNPDENPFYHIWALEGQRWMNHLYSIDLTEFDEDFNMVNNTRVQEIAIYLDDADLLNNLAFNISGSYFNSITPVNLVFPATRIPLVNQNATANDFTINLLGQNMPVSNFLVNLMGVSFDITTGVDIWEMMRAGDLREFEMFELVLVYANGDEVVYDPNSMGMGTIADWDNFEWDPENPDVFPTPTGYSFSFGGMPIDVENITAIRVNGVLVQLN